MKLFVGAYYPDKQLSDSIFGKALVEVAAGLAKNRNLGSEDSFLALDLQFMLPGRLEKPGFKGMRLHSFDAHSNTLRVESSVPSNMVNSELAKKYILAALQDAVDNASDFFAERHLSFQQAPMYDMIMSIA